MNEASSQDIIRKRIVFFLKKTTNFCTATIFDIHLVKKGKEQKQQQQSKAEKPKSPHGENRHGRAGGRRSDGPKPSSDTTTVCRY